MGGHSAGPYMRVFGKTISAWVLSTLLLSTHAQRSEATSLYGSVISDGDGFYTYAATLVQDLDRGGGDARLDGLADQAGRHRVVVLVDLNVIVGRNQTP